MTQTIYITERERAILSIFIREKILDDAKIIDELKTLIDKLDRHAETSTEKIFA